MYTRQIVISLFVYLTMLSAISYAWAGSECKKQQTEQETVVVPLKAIWAWEMPETKNLSTLIVNDPDAKAANWALLEKFSQSLKPLQPDESSEPGFVVQGTGVKALSDALAILTGKEKSPEHFSVGEELSIVFFSHAISPKVQLRKVQIKGRSIEITYRIVPNIDTGRSVSFALIPVKHLEEGEYEVSLMRESTEKLFAGYGAEQITAKEANRIVCKPFDFRVVEPDAEHIDESVDAR